MLFVQLSCLCDCKAGGGAMARHTERLLYEERKAQILAALEANGPMFNPELATYLGWSYHVVLRVTRRMENEGILAYGTRGSVAGWVIADPVPVVEPVQRPRRKCHCCLGVQLHSKLPPYPFFRRLKSIFRTGWCCRTVGSCCHWFFGRLIPMFGKPVNLNCRMCFSQVSRAAERIWRWAWSAHSRITIGWSAKPPKRLCGIWSPRSALHWALRNVKRNSEIITRTSTPCLILALCPPAISTR